MAVNWMHSCRVFVICVVLSAWHGAAYAKANAGDVSFAPPFTPLSPSEIGTPENTPLEVLNRNIFALNDGLKTLLDSEVRPYGGKRRQLVRLQRLLFSKKHLYIRYQGDLTLNAKETYEQRAGNCLSLANLFIASARYLGMEAYFQFVQIDQQWQRIGELLEVPTHINARVLVGRDVINIEFNGSYAQDSEGKRLRHTPISDTRAKAEYFNNLGAKKLLNQEFSHAIKYLEFALTLDSEAGSAWSNLGIAYKNTNDFRTAETSYLNAMKLNPENKSVAKNLHILYKEIGATRKAKKYARLIDNYEQKNPYYLEKLALEKLDEGNLKDAKKLLKKAIKIHGTEASFYHAISQVYWKMEKQKASRQALQTAVYLSNSTQKQRHYSDKLAQLKQSAH